MVELTVPPALVAEMVEPEVTPAGTVTDTLLALMTVNGALTPPIAMLVDEPRLVPVKVKLAPTSFTYEATRVIAGFAVAEVADVKAVAEVAVPPELVTLK